MRIRRTTAYVAAIAVAYSSVVHACTDVSVEGDATFCVEGDICTGAGDAPAGMSCPQAGAVAVGDCYEYVKSFNAESKACQAPVNASCQKLKSGAWGCVWDIPVPPTPAPTPSPEAPGCTHVSVEGDATFCVEGPICTGSGDEPVGWNCPMTGDVAKHECYSYVKSFNVDKAACVAPVDAKCEKLETNAWGCVWDLSPSSPEPTPEPSKDNPDQTPDQTPEPTKDDTPDQTPEPEPECTDVSVEGDATFCVKGPICSGSGDEPAGINCPVIGDMAVADCWSYVASYNGEKDACVAPVNAKCEKIHTGAWGCVWDIPAPPTPAPTPAPEKPGCTDVSVEGDATFCIDGPICSGDGEEPAGWNCPVVDDVASADCYSYLKSFNVDAAACVAPVNAKCQKIHTGAWGCVWDLSTPAPTPKETTPAPTPEPEPECTDVSVEGDATFCVKGPICSGSGDEPAGINCPVIGDMAVADCWSYVASYNGEKDACVAPVNAKCEKIHTGAWGCVWDIPAPPTPAPTPAPEKPGCTDVSVEGDATFCIDGPICSGDGEEPAGWNCPVVDDVASADCYSYLKSFNVDAAACVAPVNAKCQKIHTGAWGCVWDLSTPAPTPKETTPAPTPEETTPAPTPEETTPAPTPEETTPVPTPEETTPAPDVTKPQDQSDQTPAPTTTADTKLFANAASTTGTSSGVIVGSVIAAVVAIAAVAGVLMYRRQQAGAGDAAETVITPPASIRGDSFMQA